jgi:hypothetical protein
MRHPIKLSDDEKRTWFLKRIEERQQINPLSSEEDLVGFVRLLRRAFKDIYQRDVPGSFIRILLNDLGVAREQSESVRKKREFVFKLLDENQAYRDSKPQCRRAVELHFGEKILGIVFDEIWEEYFSDQRPKTTKNIDFHGQESLFD